MNYEAIKTKTIIRGVGISSDKLDSSVNSEIKKLIDSEHTVFDIKYNLNNTIVLVSILYI
jgi:hypothetical protein